MMGFIAAGLFLLGLGVPYVHGVLAIYMTVFASLVYFVAGLSFIGAIEHKTVTSDQQKSNIQKIVLMFGSAFGLFFVGFAAVGAYCMPWFIIALISILFRVEKKDEETE